jgi:hypothetical protein
MGSRGLVAVVLAAVLTTGCATTLVPGPGATPVPAGRVTGAAASAAGVTVMAWPEAWTAAPRSLPTLVTPFLVTIDNAGSVPIRVRHDDFELVTADGGRLAARGPYQITGFALERAPYPYLYAGPGFGFYRPYRWGWGPFGDPFWDEMYFRDPWVRVPMPTADMVAMALPETVVQPGGRVTGFLYFEHAGRSVKQVDLTAQLHDASGAPLGVVTIPFVGN